MARPDAQPANPGGDGSDDAAVTSPAPVDATEYVVRPGTGVVRPGTGVVRPGSGSGASAAAPDTSAVARAVVPETPEKPLEPIHVVLPVIPVMPAKQGFLDRLVAPKADKKAAKEAAKEADRAAKEEERAAKDAAREEERAAKEAAREAAKEADRVAREAERAEKAERKAQKQREDEAEEYDEEPEPARAAPPTAPPPTTPPAGPVRPAPASASARVDAPPVPPPAPQAPPPPPMPAPPKPAPPPPKPVPAPPRPMTAPPPTRPPAGPPVRTAPPGPPPPPPGAPVGAPPRRPGGPPPGGPGPRPGPPRPTMARPRPQPRRDDDYDDEYDQYDEYDDYDEPRRLPRLRLLIAAVVLALVAGGGGAFVGLRNGGGKPSWVAQPEQVAVAPVLGGLGTNAKQPVPATLASMMVPLLSDARLGPRVMASVVDVNSGQTLFETGGTTGAVPASTAKLITAAAVLHARGPAYQIPTRAVAGASPGEVVLIGGGDPTLAVNANGAYPGAARLDQLAAQVLKALGDQKPTKVTVDASLYTGPGFNPTWDMGDRGQYITNIAALMTDGGLRNPARITGNGIYSLQPEIDAGQAFATALGVTAPVTLVTAPPKADQLGQVLSLPISRMVETMLTKSDNMVAEAMARQVAVARGKPASFDGGAQATREVLAELKLPVEGFGLIDGSGLSYSDHVTAQLLTAVLADAASSQHPELRAIISGLPVAGWSGTLNKRYLASGTAQAAGVVRAKTGTLRAVNSLAGVAVDADGRLLAFSILADQTPGTVADPAEAALDRIAATVASCGCG